MPKPYKPGDKIGPYQIELIKKDHKNQRGEWYSWFLCPKCNKNLFYVLINILKMEERLAVQNVLLLNII